MPIRKFSGGGASVLYTRVNLTSNQNLGADYAVISWQNEAKDELGAFNAASPTRLTVPDGYTTISLIGYLVFSNYSAGSRRLKIVKNGSEIIMTVTNGSATNEAGTLIDTGLLTVVPGDYFELYADSDGVAALGNSWGGPCWFEMVSRNNITGKLTELLRSSSTTMSGWTTVPWTNKYVDESGCWDPSSPTRLTIPAGYTKARLKLLLNPTSYIYAKLCANITKNASGSPIVFAATVGSSVLALVCDTGWIDVVEGDYFVANYTDTYNYDLGSQATFGYLTTFKIELVV